MQTFYNILGALVILIVLASMAIAVAASAAFLTPIGYQTNTMIYGPGGYRFSDYFRLGLPVAILTVAMTVWLVPILWPA